MKKEFLNMEKQSLKGPEMARRTNGISLFSRMKKKDAKLLIGL
jgi:hypothetical protein